MNEYIEFTTLASPFAHRLPSVTHSERCMHEEGVQQEPATEYTQFRCVSCGMRMTLEMARSLKKSSFSR